MTDYSVKVGNMASRVFNKFSNGVEGAYTLNVISKTAEYIDPLIPSKGKAYTYTDVDIDVIEGGFIEDTQNNELLNFGDRILYVKSITTPPSESDRVTDIDGDVWEIIKVSTYSNAYYKLVIRK